jgi:hypothetical protein
MLSGRSAVFCAPLEKASFQAVTADQAVQAMPRQVELSGS